MKNIQLSDELHKRLNLIKAEQELETLDEALSFVFNDYDIFQNISPLLSKIQDEL